MIAHKDGLPAPLRRLLNAEQNRCASPDLKGACRTLEIFQFPSRLVDSVTIHITLYMFYRQVSYLSYVHCPFLASPALPLQLIFDASIIFTHGVAAAAADGGIPSGTNDQNPISGTPAYIWVRQRQDDTIFLLPEALADDERRGGEDPGAGMENKAVFELMPAGEADDEGEEEELLREGGVDGASVRKEGVRRRRFVGSSFECRPRAISDTFSAFRICLHTLVRVRF